MDQNLIDELIGCLKKINSNGQHFKLPQSGQHDYLDLKSSEHLFLVDINRKGRKKSKFTLQLRSKNHKNQPLLRLDILGQPHINPVGNFPHSGETINCPHIHIANQEYGTSIAFPLNKEYAMIYLSENEIEDLILILEKFLEVCNVGNIDDLNLSYQTELI